MAAISPRISNEEDTQARSRDTEQSKTTPQALSSRRFKDAAKHIMTTSTKGSSTGMHHDAAPPLHPLESGSSTSGRVRRNSLSNVVACATNSPNCTAAECGTGNNSGISGGKDCRHPLSNISLAGSKSKLGLQARRASGNLASASSKGSNSRVAATSGAVATRVTYAETKNHATIKDSVTHRRTNEICMDCRSRISRMESLCFITNDGKISAALTGALHARHSHHCNVRGCARIQTSCQPPSPSLRTDPVSTKQAKLNPQPTRRKSVNTLSGRRDHRRTASSVQGDNRQKSSLRSSAEASSTSTGSATCEIKKGVDLKEVSINHSEDSGRCCVSTISHCHMPIDQSGQLDEVSSCRECSSRCSRMPQVRIDQESYVENRHVEKDEVRSSLAASSASLDIHGDDDDDKASLAYRNDIRSLNDFQGCTSYHGDNEYSCSEGGTDATTTPISSSRGEFDHPSDTDIEQSPCEHEMSCSKRSAVARISRKYLESLAEQEAEKVRLRKKEIMDRKQAGDWMLDCRMGEVLHQLAPTGAAHVKVLVEAFETIMHQSDSDCSQTAHHLDQEHVETPCHAKASS